MLLHLLGAMGLGLILGYERAFFGCAAGMRTFALGCMASCALTILVGCPNQWFGGQLGGGIAAMPPAFTDPTRVIQGVVTGIGFRCAGVICARASTSTG